MVKIIKSKIALFTAAVILFLSVTQVRISAISETTPISWYTKRSVNHQPPPLDGNLHIIEKYNAYYLDKNAPVTDKVIYLTFDAGYENGNIEKILDILKEHKTPAAFFILSQVLKQNTDLILRMINEGHMVANHTVKHRDMSKITEKTEFAKELSALEDQYRKNTGFEMPKIYRPPEGIFSELNLIHATELGYATVFWSIAYADWDNNNQPEPEASKKKLLDNTHNGAVILLHPTSATNVMILGSLLDEWASNGYRFGTLNELIKRSGDETVETQ